MGGTCKSTQKKTRENLLGAIKKRKIGLATVASTKKPFFLPQSKRPSERLTTSFYSSWLFFEGEKNGGSLFGGLILIAKISSRVFDEASMLLSLSFAVSHILEEKKEKKYSEVKFIIRRHVLTDVHKYTTVSVL